MFCKILATIGLFISVSACAVPNYQTSHTDLTQQAQKDGQCTLLFKTQSMCVDLAWTVSPTDSAAGEMTLKFYGSDAVAAPVEPSYAVSVVLWMPAMGHGSSPVRVEKLENGIYKASNIFFVMPGEWEIRVQLKDGKNVVDQVSQAISI